MRRIFNPRVGCLLVLGFILIASTGLIYQWVSNPTTIAQQLASLAAPTATLPPLQRAPNVTEATPGASPKPCSAKQRDFEMGVTFPQWYGAGYGGDDNEWLFGLPEMRKQTGSCWVEMPVLLYQRSPDSIVNHPWGKYPFCLVPGLRDSACSSRRVACLCFRAFTNRRISVLAWLPQIFELCAAAAMVPDLLAGIQTLYTSYGPGRSGTICGGNRRRVVARKCPR